MNTLLILIATAITGFAADIKLAWDSSVNATNYALYASTNILSATNLSTSAVKLNVGTNLTCAIEGLNSGQWSFAVTAFLDGVESEPSNILIVEVPASPKNFRTVVVQYGGTLTNFFDVGFFRLRIQ